jgi:hypothetical protein
MERDKSSYESKTITKIAIDWPRRFPMEQQRNRSLAIVDLLFRVVAPLLSRRTSYQSDIARSNFSAAVDLTAIPGHLGTPILSQVDILEAEVQTTSVDRSLSAGL